MACSFMFGISVPEFPANICRDCSNVFTALTRHARASREGPDSGLAIAKHVVRAHGGTIKAESELNHGSTFYFTLPRQPVPVTGV